MHLRRALLLFAIVLGVAAIAASLAPPPDSERTPTRQQPPPPTTTEQSAEETVEAEAPPEDAGTERLRFEAAARTPAERTIEAGTHAIVTVTVAEPGQVRIDSLGRVEFATPQAPVVFDLLLTDPGRHEIAFAPVEGETSPAGTLIVEG